jgi:hypothetical protein
MDPHWNTNQLTRNTRDQKNEGWSMHPRIDRQKAVRKLTITAAESGKLALMAMSIGMDWKLSQKKRSSL